MKAAAQAESAERARQHKERDTKDKLIFVKGVTSAAAAGLSLSRRALRARTLERALGTS